MRKIAALYFLIFLLPALATAQTIVSGTITNAQTAQPIVGATIKASTGESTQTNYSGNYSLSVSADANYLVVSHIGFVADTIRIALGQQANYSLQLQPRQNVLSEVKVQGYETNRPLLETAAAISIVSSDVLQQTDESSLVRAVNTVPGVKMDERAPASYRISVRGSTLRSPYGIRNVKLYYNGIPLTEANGTTSLNLLDAASIGTIEILKGPTGSIYGAGTGGTLLLEPRRAGLGKEVGAGLTVGSFGYRKYNISAGAGSAKHNVLVQYNQQQYDGFREQSAVDRKVLLISPEFYLSDRQTLTSHVIYSDLYYELPGGLTLEQYKQNPRQARGGEFGSVKQQAAMNQETINIGLKHDYRFNDNWSNSTLVYTLQRFRDHPFNTDYERNATQEIGARSSFVYNTTIGNVATAFTFGGEFQRGFEVARTYDNNSGTAGKLRTDDEVTAKTGFVFGQAELELPSDFILTLALSLNDTQYRITRLVQVASGNYNFVKDFEAVLSPRVALLKKLSDRVSIHGSVSAGFSPPTEEEILTSDGVLNQDLEAEKGTNYELGLRGYALQNKLYVDVVGYYFRLKETIVSRQDASSVAVFRNVGSTSQKGIEAALKYTIVDAPAAWVNYSNVWASYTYSHYRFKEYQQNEANYSGNRLTGVAPHMLSAGFDVTTQSGLYLNLLANYSDELPLNDANTVYADSYLVTGVKLGIRRTIAGSLKLDVFAGVDNLTDENYSLGNDVNAFGGRFYQPAPPRNFYSGLNLKYVFN
ncbi:TonB-dependent receptor domain-containing protein [Pontibacter burrus]|uniref:TonB-dependent receptor plug domain-containing protein n=1 Tax=Pontibacter burrus TaxID=2704466 RepID=A0A6B3M260_9BACT|nr:TonB-dependent receptor [Pontibacter burrus]NEM99671.1 TonB-dependent receptor plug domain-containing protein [Pontibacter burrus]